MCPLISFSILTLEVCLQLGALIAEDSINNLVLDSTLLVSLAQPSELQGILEEGGKLLLQMVINNWLKVGLELHESGIYDALISS